MEILFHHLALAGAPKKILLCSKHLQIGQGQGNPSHISAPHTGCLATLPSIPRG